MAEGQIMKKIKFVGSTSREKIFALIAIILLLLVLVRGKMELKIPGLDEYYTIRDRFETKSQLYQRYRALLNEKQHIEEVHHANIQVIETLEKKLFRGRNINVTAAKLQKMIQSLATANHISIARTNIEKPEKIADNLYMIRMAVYGEANRMTDINAFLARLEYNRDKYLFAPRLYLKLSRGKLLIEMKIFSLAMTNT